MSEELTQLNEEKTDIFVEETRTHPLETLEVQIAKPREDPYFGVPLLLKENKGLQYLTNLEEYKPVFFIIEKKIYVNFQSLPMVNGLSL